MKRILKSIARALWKGSHPFRRPFSRKLHTVISNHRSAALVEIEQQVVHNSQTVLERLGGIEARTMRLETIFQERLDTILQERRLSVVEELSLMLDGMVRELTRLQSQVEVLHYMIDEQSTEVKLMRYGIVDETDPCVPFAARDGERSPAEDRRITEAGCASGESSAA
jgi:hypothetical protein